MNRIWTREGKYGNIEGGGEDLDVSAVVKQSVNVWAMKRMMNVAQSQVQQIVQSAPAAVNLEPHKGTMIDVKL